MRVLVSVGTDHHPFERLVGWAERWAADHPDDTVVIQHGHTRPPSSGRAVELMARAEMAGELASADVVVVSCGPGAAMDARAAGRLPVVVARRQALGEHVDDHQAAFARHLDAHGLARRIEDEHGFVAVLAEAAADPSAFTVVPDDSEPPAVARIGRLIDELVWD